MRHDFQQFERPFERIGWCSQTWRLCDAIHA
jgi:hypothetical protein